MFYDSLSFLIECSIVVYIDFVEFYGVIIKVSIDVSSAMTIAVTLRDALIKVRAGFTDGVFYSISIEMSPNLTSTFSFVSSLLLKLFSIGAGVKVE